MTDSNENKLENLRLLMKNIKSLNRIGLKKEMVLITEIAKPEDYKDIFIINNALSIILDIFKRNRDDIVSVYAKKSFVDIFTNKYVAESIIEKNNFLDNFIDEELIKNCLDVMMKPKNINYLEDIKTLISRKYSINREATMDFIEKFNIDFRIVSKELSGEKFYNESFIRIYESFSDDLNSKDFEKKEEALKQFKHFINEHRSEIIEITKKVTFSFESAKMEKIQDTYKSACAYIRENELSSKIVEKNLSNNRLKL